MNKGGRPSKGDDARTSLLGVMVSKKELAALRAWAGTESLSAKGRELLLAALYDSRKRDDGAAR